MGMHGLENSGTVSYYLLIKVIWEIKGIHTYISTIFPGVSSIHVCIILSLTMDNGSWALKFFPVHNKVSVTIIILE